MQLSGIIMQLSEKLLNMYIKFTRESVQSAELNQVQVYCFHRKEEADQKHLNNRSSTSVSASVKAQVVVVYWSVRFRCVLNEAVFLGLDVPFNSTQGQAMQRLEEPKCYRRQPPC